MPVCSWNSTLAPSGTASAGQRRRALSASRRSKGTCSAVMARRVVLADRGPHREDVDPAAAQHQLGAGVALQLGPGRVRRPGPAHVGGRVVAQPDDPGVAVRGARAHDPARSAPARRPAPPPGELPRRRAAERTQPDDDDVEGSGRVVGRSAHACLIQPGDQPAPDVERRVLHRGVPALGVERRRHPALHALADRPVLAVDQVPEPGAVLESVPSWAGSTRTSKMIRVRSAPSGVSTKDAACSADSDSSRFG